MLGKAIVDTDKLKNIFDEFAKRYGWFREKTETDRSSMKFDNLLSSFLQELTLFIGEWGVNDSHNMVALEFIRSDISELLKKNNAKVNFVVEADDGANKILSFTNLLPLTVNLFRIAENQIQKIKEYEDFKKRALGFEAILNRIDEAKSAFHSNSEETVQEVEASEFVEFKEKLIDLLELTKTEPTVELYPEILLENIERFTSSFPDHPEGNEFNNFVEDVFHLIPENYISSVPISNSQILNRIKKLKFKSEESPEELKDYDEFKKEITKLFSPEEPEVEQMEATEDIRIPEEIVESEEIHEKSEMTEVPAVVDATVQDAKMDLNNLKSELLKIKTKLSEDEVNAPESYQTLINWIKIDLIGQDLAPSLKAKIETFVELFDLEKNNLDPIVEFKRWNGYLKVLSKNFENELIFPLTQILEDGEEFGLFKSKQVFSIPINKQLKKRAEDVEGIVSALLEVSHSGLKKEDVDLLAIPKSYLRGAEELDIYFFDRSNAVSEKVNAFLKDKLRNVLLIIKGLTSTGRKKLPILLNDISKIRKEFYKNRFKLLYFGLLDILESIDVEEEWTKQNSKDWEKYLAELDFKTFQDFEDHSNKMKRKFIDFLNKNILRTLINLKQSKKLFQEELLKDEFSTDEKEILNNLNWEELFNQLIAVFVWNEEEGAIPPDEKGFINKYLHILPIGASRGGAYNHHLHLPIAEGVPDDQLENDSIKEVDAEGYLFMGNNLSETTYSELEKLSIDKILESEFPHEFVVQQAKVIVVKN